MVVKIMTLIARGIMKQNTHILLVDDEPNSREALTTLLTGDHQKVRTASSLAHAFDLLGGEHFDIVIADLMLPDGSGIDILKWVKEKSPRTSVIMITGMGTAETAVRAMKEGAFDYITKPLNFSELQVVIDKALETGKLVAENIYLRQQLRGKYKFDNIIGNSPAMQQLFTRMEKIVNTDSTVLVLGASGTGKELVARAIHFNSSRKEHPFVAINCGAIPADLLESELFGHVKGAFTGAVADKPGKFELANYGTIFLDEIANMPLHLQMKLLRVLQEQELERVGSGRKIKLNVRVISATNAALEAEVKAGRFREDLYYRLNVIPIVLPALKDRREDIALLARHFLTRCCKTMGRGQMTLTPGAIRALELYDWPGNVREMENVIERTVALTDSDLITPQELPPALGAIDLQEEKPLPHPAITAAGIDLPATIAEIERNMIEEALQMTNGVKARAATLLHLNRTTLVEKMKRLGLEL